MTDIWKGTKNVLIVTEFKGVEILSQWRHAMKAAGFNINHCQLLAVIKSKKNRSVLREMTGVVFLSEGDIGLFGQLKYEKAKSVLSETYDLLIVDGSVSKKIMKEVNKVNCSVDIGLNTGHSDRTIDLISEDQTPLHLLNFVKQTLEKIT